MVLRSREDRYLHIFGAGYAQYNWTVFVDAAENLCGRAVGAAGARGNRRGRGVRRCVRSSANAACGAGPASCATATTSPIIGAGSHGLATAYYLARDHGITDVCVLDMGYMGSGAAGRNTTILRSNYKTPEGAALLRRLPEALRAAWAPSSKSLGRLRLPGRRRILADTDRAMFVMTERAEVNRLHGIDSRVVAPARDPEDGAGRWRSATTPCDPVQGALYHAPGRDHPPRRRGLGAGARGRPGRGRDPSIHQGDRRRAFERARRPV